MLLRRGRSPPPYVARTMAAAGLPEVLLCLGGDPQAPGPGPGVDPDMEISETLLRTLAIRLTSKWRHSNNVG